MIAIPTTNSIPESLRLALEKDLSILCPSPDLVFRAFYEFDLPSVKAVILGLGPYPVLGKSNGLAFGCHEDYDGPIDSALYNIAKEVKRSTGLELTDYTLESWARQGVLLLNTRLTAVEGKAMAHAGLGWETTISAFLERLSDSAQRHVYMLWGQEAQGYKKFINESYHHVLETTHPCGLSAYRGFLGCGHFAKANKYLVEHGREAIVWGELPDEAA